jgi:transcriptional regulator with XRE-family HTH domain
MRHKDAIGDDTMFCLKEERVRRGFTQGRIAEQVKIARGTYANIENGARRPSVTVAKRIAAVLGFDWIEFFADPSVEQEDGEKV